MTNKTEDIESAQVTFSPSQFSRLLILIFSLSWMSVARAQTPGWPTEVVFEPSEVFSVHSTELRPTAIVKDYFGTVLRDIPLTWTVETGTCTVSSPGVIRTGNRYFGTCSIAVRPTNAMVQSPGRVTIYEQAPTPTPTPTVTPAPNFTNVDRVVFAEPQVTVTQDTVLEPKVEAFDLQNRIVTNVPFFWETNENDGCRVDGRGRIFAQTHFVRGCLVTARSPNGKIARLTMNFDAFGAPNLPTEEIESGVERIIVNPGYSSAPAGTTRQLTVLIYGPRGQLISPPVRWYSHNTATCHITNNGLVTMRNWVRNGQCLFTVAAGGKTGVAIVESLQGVNPNPMPPPTVTNKAPQGGISPSKFDAQRGETILLTSKAVDDGIPGNNLLTYRWVQVSGPATSQIANPSNRETNVAMGSAVGDYMFQVVVSDGEQTSVSRIKITVR
jgi:hypothetical protein